ncbi:MAG: hypothetical protein KIS94_02975 [Chitinophagales bacterium]|nr:hypothetical protein [Chitinophagales bacterium]
MKTKRILIPTDFSVSSLNVLKTVLGSNLHGEKYDIILLHGIRMNDSISDLLFFSKNNLLRSVSNPEFDHALMVLKNKYASSIQNIRSDVFTGYNQSAFNSYLEANRIDEAYVSENYCHAKAGKQSFDVSPYILKSNLKVNGVRLATQEIPEKGQVAEILLNSVPAR